MMEKKLKAPQVDRYLWSLGRMGYSHNEHIAPYNDTSNALLDELFELLKRIKPVGQGNAWRFWVRADRGGIEDFGDYEDMLREGEVENYEEFVACWKSSYLNETEWYELQAIYAEDIGYRAVVLQHRTVVEFDSRKEKSEFAYDITEFAQWLVDATKEVIAELEAGIYNERLEQKLPVEHRTGTLLRKHEWEIWPHIKEQILGDLTDSDIAEFLASAEETMPDKSPFLKQITANDFYRFCAMGYAANKYDGCDRSPKEQYMLHADRRDEGLGEIAPDSPEAFADWYHTRNRGGHPWEVCRGGNSTHISLYVCHNEDGWSLVVAGSAWTRCLEAMRFFLALHRAGLPVAMREAAMLKARVLGEEKIGVVPKGVFPAYCQSYFPGEDVIDYMNLPDEEADRKWLAERCVWQPIEHVGLSEG